MAPEARPSGEAPVLWVVVPCFDEEQALPETAPVLAAKIDALAAADDVARGSRILLVDDGSHDATWEVVRALHEADARIAGLRLAHNAGQQKALYAGLMRALEGGCDCAVTIDADLQDDVDAVDEMLRRFSEGAEVVYGVRESRDADGTLKRGTAGLFYRLMGWLGAETVPEAADFRLMGRRSLEALARYEEANLFLRGIVPSLGFETAQVRYARSPRAAGTSKYSLGRMLGLALDGITSFSIRPVRIVTCMGLLAILVSLAMIAYALASSAAGSVVAGWTSLMISVWLVGGMLMTSLGVVGEYVGRTYLEAKRRPRYIVAETLD